MINKIKNYGTLNAEVGCFILKDPEVTLSLRDLISGLY